MGFVRMHRGYGCRRMHVRACTRYTGNFLCVFLCERPLVLFDICERERVGLLSCLECSTHLHTAPVPKRGMMACLEHITSLLWVPALTFCSPAEPTGWWFAGSLYIGLLCVSCLARFCLVVPPLLSVYALVSVCTHDSGQKIEGTFLFQYEGPHVSVHRGISAVFREGELVRCALVGYR